MFAVFEHYFADAHVHGIQGQILYLCDAADPVAALDIVEQDLRKPLCELLCYHAYVVVVVVCLA